MCARLIEPIRKRAHKEHNEDRATLSTLTSVRPVKKVVGFIVNLSPMKKENFGSSYFNGQISDGSTSMCFVDMI